MLNNRNVLLYAMRHYERNITDLEDFTSDYNRIKYIKRLFFRYKQGDELKIRLVLNHLVVLYNVFVPSVACTELLLFLLKDFDNLIAPFIKVMGFEPEGISLYPVFRFVEDSESEIIYRKIMFEINRGKVSRGV